MDYLLENLNPETFQEFCQALLVLEFPGLQCFPVGQPDGGRDAVQRFVSPDSEQEKIVFQVKFVRNPNSLQDPRKWLIDTLQGEAPKVAKLIPKGATCFVLLTNVRGTSHLDSGSIDKVSEILDANLPIPAACWWRDDINRRLDSAHDLKWVYPGLLSGMDVIRDLVENRFSEHRERRARTIKAFLKDQHEGDKKVRFKQTDLQGSLLDLFVDVPVSLKENYTFRGKQLRSRRDEVRYANFFFRHMRTRYHLSMDEPLLVDEQEFIAEHEDITTATDTLLNQAFQNHIPRVVLEGAPGQGKSTIAQYLCQIHRGRILNQGATPETIPESYLNTPIRIPFKIDLRDLATWLSGDDPFSSDEHSSIASGQRSLEGFLAALVVNHSGGAAFSVEDIQAVVEITPILLVLDGLDEVANIDQRQQVVTAVTKGVKRLEEIRKQLQVVITSRPAAFSNSPGFSESDFVYLELLPLNRLHINEYAEKWALVRELDSKDKSELMKTLRAKLDQPHLRELSKNPMQLAILLNLIHTKGMSLPDKRTLLYNTYMELFFDREAEKSPVVREHRDLLQQIHGYIAWVLHSEAEQGESGRVNAERFRTLVENYLSREGYDIGSVDELFQGMVERVVAIVSRVEGTFEFDVQPIREFFTADYLYKTAAYSPAGEEKSGTLPDRFDAIAQNFYWLNVTRFYAGFYNKGELASLIERLKDLANRNGYKLTSHPRNLTAMLLADYVFSQHPNSLKEVIGLILDRLGLRHLLGATYSRRGALDSVLSLPDKCGRHELVERAFDILSDMPAADYRHEIANIIKVNSPLEERLELWKNYLIKSSRESRGYWLEQALSLELLHKVPDDEIKAFFLTLEDETVYQTLCRARRESILNSSHMVAQKTIDLILDGAIGGGRRQVKTPFEALSFSLDAIMIATSIRMKHDDEALLSTILNNILYLGDVKNFFLTKHEESSEENWQKFDLENLNRCMNLFFESQRLLKLPAATWGTQLGPWDTVLEKSRDFWGERWLHYEFANIASGIKSKTETCKGFSNLLDPSISLCCRARYARLRSGANSSRWWVTQFTKANHEREICFVLLIVLTWGKSDLLTDLFSEIDKAVAGLSERGWTNLYKSLRKSIGVFGDQMSDYSITFNVKLLAQLKLRTHVLLGLRSEKYIAEQILELHQETYEGSDRFVWEFFQNVLIQKLSDESSLEMRHLRIIERAYAQGVTSWYIYSYRQRSAPYVLTLEAATKVTMEPDKYPQGLVALAERRWRQEVSSKIVPVAEIAEKDNWTFS